MRLARMRRPTSRDERATGLTLARALLLAVALTVVVLLLIWTLGRGKDPSADPALTAPTEPAVETPAPEPAEP